MKKLALNGRKINNIDIREEIIRLEVGSSTLLSFL